MNIITHFVECYISSSEKNGSLSFKYDCLVYNVTKDKELKLEFTNEEAPTMSVD